MTPPSDLPRSVVQAHQASITFGARCESCGLSEHGARRFRSFGFPTHPCRRCPAVLTQLGVAA